MSRPKTCVAILFGEFRHRHDEIHIGCAHAGSSGLILGLIAWRLWTWALSITDIIASSRRSSTSKTFRM
jgi:hypothetical protein